MNAVGLRKKFMQEMSEELLDQYMAVVRGEQKFTSNNATARVEMWDLLKHAIMSTKDTQEQDFKNTNDIIKAVSEGSISAQDAKEMMHLLNMQKVIDTEGMTAEGLGPLGFSFFIKDESKIVAGSNVNKDPDIIKAPKTPSKNSIKPDEDNFEW